MAGRFAFYDLDGTLVSSNVVTQFVYYVRRLPSRRQALAKGALLAASLPWLGGLELVSRRAFNVWFYRFYRGMRRDWLLAMAEGLFETVIRPAIYPGAPALVKRDRAEGFRTVLVTGSPDFALGPVVRYFGFDRLVANCLEFSGGVATGRIRPPVLAGREKVAAIERLCRQYNVDTAESKAYSDSLSDLPMLEAVGRPAVVHPGYRLRRIARRRGWPVLDLKNVKG
jgi:HAD superfamily hydrolase (TIGR01490 family)